MSDGSKLTVVLTGSTGAIGGAIATGLAKSNNVSTLILVVRDAAKGEAVAAKLRSPAVNVEVALADLVKPASVAQCAAGLCEKLPKIDVLVNNAATVEKKREEVNGLERQFAVNVLSYLVMMKGLLPKMGEGGRVVCVASMLASGLDLSDLQTSKKSYAAMDVYARTKQVRTIPPPCFFCASSLLA